MGALWKLRGPSFPAEPITGPMMKRNIFRQHIIDRRRPGSGLWCEAWQHAAAEWVTTRRMWLLTTGAHIKSEERLQHCSSAPLQNQTICRRNKIIGNCGWKCFGNFIDLRIQIPNRGLLRDYEPSDGLRFKLYGCSIYLQPILSGPAPELAPQCKD